MEALEIAVFVFELTATVPTVIAAASEEEAVPTTVLVLPFTTEAIEEEAVAIVPERLPT